MDNQANCKCSACGEIFKMDVHQSINVSKDPSLKGKVLDGSLFMGECPRCGQNNLARYTTLYHDPSQKLLVLLSDGNRAAEDAIAKAFTQSEGMDGYTARFVDDVGSLVEKVKIFDAGLDDRAMEMCKYVTCMEMGKELSFKFFRLDGADGDITLTYPGEGQMEMVNIGFNVYSDCERILSRNPSITQQTTGFVRIDSQWIARFFR